MAWFVVIIYSICVLLNLGKICEDKVKAKKDVRTAYIVSVVLQLITIHLIASAYL